jgi:hypothetical protein
MALAVEGDVGHRANLGAVGRFISGERLLMRAFRAEISEPGDHWSLTAH